MIGDTLLYVLRCATLGLATAAVLILFVALIVHLIRAFCLAFTERPSNGGQDDASV